MKICVTKEAVTIEMSVQEKVLLRDCLDMGLHPKVHVLDAHGNRPSTAAVLEQFLALLKTWLPDSVSKDLSFTPEALCAEEATDGDGD